MKARFKKFPFMEENERTSVTCTVKKPSGKINLRKQGFNPVVV
jgi:hypothetical protein